MDIQLVGKTARPVLLASVGQVLPESGSGPLWNEGLWSTVIQHRSENLVASSNIEGVEDRIAFPGSVAGFPEEGSSFLELSFRKRSSDFYELFWQRQEDGRVEGDYISGLCHYGKIPWKAKRESFYQGSRKLIHCLLMHRDPRKQQKGY